MASTSIEHVAVKIIADNKTLQYLCINLTLVKELEQIPLSAYMYPSSSSMWTFQATTRMKLVKWKQNVIFAKTTK